ncbi:MAG: hypothetical protein ACI8P0_003294 [Planctomycetaceae bacterium]|jgi:hypothetical protein
MSEIPPELLAESERPEHCRRCGSGLTGTDAEPLRHQVWELPVLPRMQMDLDLRAGQR